MSPHRFITKSLVAGLAAVALAAPVASAAGPAPRSPLTHEQQQPAPAVTSQERQVLASRGQGSPEQAPKPTPPVVSSDSGFDWGSAAIGAGIAGGVTLLVVAGFGLAERRPVRVAH